MSENFLVKGETLEIWRGADATLKDLSSAEGITGIDPVSAPPTELTIYDAKTGTVYATPNGAADWPNRQYTIPAADTVTLPDPDSELTNNLRLMYQVKISTLVVMGGAVRLYNDRETNPGGGAVTETTAYAKTTDLLNGSKIKKELVDPHFEDEAGFGVAPVAGVGQLTEGRRGLTNGVTAVVEFACTASLNERFITLKTNLDFNINNGGFEAFSIVATVNHGLNNSVSKILVSVKHEYNGEIGLTSRSLSTANVQAGYANVGGKLAIVVDAITMTNGGCHIQALGGLQAPGISDMATWTLSAGTSDYSATFGEGESSSSRSEESGFSPLFERSGDVVRSAARPNALQVSETGDEVGMGRPPIAGASLTLQAATAQKYGYGLGFDNILGSIYGGSQWTIVNTYMDYSPAVDSQEFLLLRIESYISANRPISIDVSLYRAPNGTYGSVAVVNASHQSVTVKYGDNNGKLAVAVHNTAFMNCTVSVKVQNSSVLPSDFSLSQAAAEPAWATTETVIQNHFEKVIINGDATVVGTFANPSSLYLKRDLVPADLKKLQAGFEKLGVPMAGFWIDSEYYADGMPFTGYAAEQVIEAFGEIAFKYTFVTVLAPAREAQEATDNTPAIEARPTLYSIATINLLGAWMWCERERVAKLREAAATLRAADVSPELNAFCDAITS